MAIEIAPLTQREYIQDMYDDKKPDSKLRPAFDDPEIDAIVRGIEEDVETERSVQRNINHYKKTVPAFRAIFEEVPAQGHQKKEEEQKPENTEEKTVSSFVELLESAKLDSSLARGACPWLDKYVEFSKKASPEGYEDYHVACGLWALSTASARRIYLPMQLERFYGNLSIALTGRSSLFAKSLTAKVAKHILENAGLGYLIGPNRATPARLLSIMSGLQIPADYNDQSSEMQEYKKKELAMSAQKGLFFDELGKFIQGTERKGSTTADYIEILLEMDACPDKYKNETVIRSSEPIERPYLPVLGGMTPANLRQNAQAGAAFWSDGWWGRFSFATAPSDDAKDEALETGELLIPEELTRPIKDWHRRLGIPVYDIIEQVDQSGKPTGKHQIEVCVPPTETACTIAPDAYQAWKQYRSALKTITKKSENEDFDASYQRLPTTALRIAVLIASLENNNRIELRHWAKAQELAEMFRKGLHCLYDQVNSSGTNGLFEKKLLKEIEKKFSPDKEFNTRVLARTSSQFSNEKAERVNQTLESFERAGFLARVPGKRAWYTLAK